MLVLDVAISSMLVLDVAISSSRLLIVALSSVSLSPMRPSSSPAFSMSWSRSAMSVPFLPWLFWQRSLWAMSSASSLRRAAIISSIMPIILSKCPPFLTATATSIMFISLYFEARVSKPVVVYDDFADTGDDAGSKVQNTSAPSPAPQLPFPDDGLGDLLSDPAALEASKQEPPCKDEQATAVATETP